MLRAVAGSGVTSLTIGASTITGGATTQVLFNLAGVVSSSANLTFLPTGSVGSGPQFSVGTGSAGSAGWHFGTYSPGNTGIWPTSVTPTVNNYTLADVSQITYLGAQTVVRITTQGNTYTKGEFSNLAGTGLSVTAGTAATNVGRALSISQTWTDGTSSNIGIVGNFDMGATGTATGDLLQLNAGPDASTNVFAVSNLGGLSLGSAILLRNMVSFASGAAAQVGTLTNAPTAGNPAKFLFIVDNGQTLAIPAWSV